MPGAELVLDHRQRDALRGEAAESLENISAIAMAIRAGEWERARRMREDFNGVMRLVDDLGWAPEDDGEQFALTMSVGWLARVVRDLRGATARKPEDSIGTWTGEPYREAARSWLLALRTYSVVLETIAELSDAGAAADSEGGVAYDAGEIPRRVLGRMPMAAHPTEEQGSPAEAELSPERIRSLHDGPAARVEKLIERGRDQGAFRTNVPTTWQIAVLHQILHGAGAEVAAGRLSPADAPGLINKTVRTLLEANQTRSDSSRR